MKLTPEQRSIALMHALGWQGGTIHQVAEVTGCTPQELLHAEPIDHSLSGPHSMGFSAVRTCCRHVFESFFDDQFGRVLWWLGVAEGQHLHDNGSPSFVEHAACKTWGGGQ